MPRGYLKHQGRAVGRKKARGSCGHKSYNRDPWFWAWKGEMNSRDSKSELKLQTLEYIDELNSVDGWSDDEYDDYDCEITGQTEKTEIVAETGPTTANAASAADCSSPQSSNDTDSFAVISYEQGTSGSFSLCGDLDEISFLSVDQDADASSFSTCWDFVTDSKAARKQEEKVSIIDSCCDQVPVGGDVLLTDLDLSELNVPDLESTSTSLPVTCAICLEEKTNLVRLFKKCRHPDACYDCLRKHYVENEMKEVSNYPLECFWPGCVRCLRSCQIQRLSKSEAEVATFRSFECRAAQQRAEKKAFELEEGTRLIRLKRQVEMFKTVHYCPECTASNRVYPCQQKSFDCKECQKSFPINISRQEVEDLARALGDVLANCPSCSVLIAKDGGCDHMHCVCGKDFSFHEFACFEARKKI